MFILSLCATCSAGIDHVIRKATSNWSIRSVYITCYVLIDAGIILFVVLL